MFGFNREKKDQEIFIKISNKSLFKIILFILGFYLLIIFLTKISYAIQLIFISIFLTLAINSPVHKLSRHIPGKMRNNRTFGTIISLIIVLTALGILIVSIAPPLINQTSTFLKNTPSLLNNLHDNGSQLGNIIHRYHLNSQLDSISAQLSNKLSNSGSSAISTLSKVTGSIVSVITVFVLTFMMLIEGPAWLKFIHGLLEPKKSEKLLETSNKMYGVIKGYVNGQVLMAAIAAIVVLIPLLILNISYPIALMVIVFICALIPVVGHTIGIVIVASVALFHSVFAAVIIIAYYILYMQIESYVIQPKIQSNKTNLSSLMVFLALLVGLSFDGLIGGLLAIPIAGCLKILVEEFLINYKKTRLLDTNR